MRANHDFNVNELVVLWESQLMTRSQPMSQQSWFPRYIRHYGSNNCCLHLFQLFQQLRLSQYSRRPGTARRFQRSHSQPKTREFGNRNQERRHKQEGHSCSSRITKNTGTAQGDSNRGRCVRTGAVPKFTSYGRGSVVPFGGLRIYNANLPADTAWQAVAWRAPHPISLI